MAPAAQADLLDLHDYIAARSGGRIAISYTRRIKDHCASFAYFGERGTRRNDLRDNLRTVGFENRVTIAFHVTPKMVIIDRILYGGRDLGSALPLEE